MKKEVLPGAGKYIKAHQRRKRWNKVVSGLACIAVFCTVYALILPAITMEKEACQIPEHSHSEACYTQVTSVTGRVPVCSAERLNLHQHGDTCYDSEGKLTCGYADFVVHQHDSFCFDENGNLWCTLPEIKAHAHDESCYAIVETEPSTEVHTHTDDCYTVECGELICTEPTEPAHTHTDDCYVETVTLVCTEDHEHDESCCETVRELTCGYTEEPAHQHSDACYEQIKTLICDLPAEPVEETEKTEPVLICNQAEIILHEHASDCFDEYGNLICGKIQVLEHQHTDACFEAVEEPLDANALTCTSTDEGHTHGPLCYGTWELTCGMEEHTHGPACTPAVETEEDWTEAFSASLTGNWPEDMVIIAASQLGYRQSDTDVITDEAGNQIGATRYGVWYKNPYAPWNALFPMFCMYYAQIPEEAVPRSANIQEWVDLLCEWEIYRTREEAAAIAPVEVADSETEEDNNEAVVADSEIVAADGEIMDNNSEITAAKNTPEDSVNVLMPQSPVSPGDVAFFDTDADGAADRTGVIVQIQDGMVTTIQGDVEGEVRSCTTPAEDSSILGYGLVSEIYQAMHMASTYAEGPIIVHNNDEYVQAFSNSGTYEVQLANNIDIANICVDLVPGDNITLDLNGKTLKNTGSGSIFRVQAGATLIITDSQNLQPEVTKEKDADQSQKYGRYDSQYDDDCYHLKYYTTEVDSTNGITGRTEEAVYHTTVVIPGNIGKIDGGNKEAPIFLLDGGTLEIQDGMICNSANRAVYASNNATLNISGGYICMNRKTTVETNGGAAICAVDSSINMTGGYIFHNETTNGGRGGAIFASDGGTLTFSGGVIAGNKSHIGSSDAGGGAVAMDNVLYAAIYGTTVSNNFCEKNGGAFYCRSRCSVGMFSGYVTNNIAQWSGDKNWGNNEGGGGFRLENTSYMTMDGGFITGNLAASGGGISIVNNSGLVEKMTMNGGYVCSNSTQSRGVNAGNHEGGGISIQSGNIVTLCGGYVNNNSTGNTDDWGGGGIFCAEGGQLSIPHLLATDNTAGGFGGGVSGCPTSHISVVEDGAAIFENTAWGVNMAGATSTKFEDRDALNDPVFMASGYNDFFCAWGSSVQNGMLGGGTAEWSGSADGVAVSAAAGERGYWLISSVRMGLNAAPSAADKQAARDAAKGSALYVTGNYSYTHGGAIMCNGIMTIGPNIEGIEIPANLKLHAKKRFLDGNGEPLDQTERQFGFEILDSSNAVVSTGYSGSDGKITFDRQLSFRSPATYTYTVRERPSGDASILTDSRVYRLSIEVKENIYSQAGVKITQHYIQSIAISSFEDSENQSPAWEKLWDWDYSNKGLNHYAVHSYEVTLGRNADSTTAGDTTKDFEPAFYNIRVNEIKIRIIKNWVDDNAAERPASITVSLFKNGMPVDGGSEKELRPDNNWTAEWGPYSEPADGTKVNYTVQETIPEGYLQTGTTIVDKVEDGAAWRIITITNTSEEQADYTIKLTKYGAGKNPGDPERLLANAHFELCLKNADGSRGEALKFIKKKDGVYTYTSGAENVWDLVTGAQGQLTLEGLPFGSGEYMLHEMSAPFGYMPVQDIPVNLHQNQSLPDNVVFANGVYQLMVTDPLQSYKLPQTGGTGMTPYTMGGMLLMAAAGASLLYNHSKRRKEDAASS